MTIETLSLHPFRAEDAQRLTDLITSPGVLKYLTLPTPYKLEHAQDFINRCITQHLPQCGVWVNGELAGCIGLGNPPGGDASISPGRIPQTDTPCKLAINPYAALR